MGFFLRVNPYGETFQRKWARKVKSVHSSIGVVELKKIREGGSDFKS